MKWAAGQRLDNVSLAAGILAVTFLVWLCSERFADLEKFVSFHFLSGYSGGATPSSITTSPDTLVDVLIKIAVMALFSTCAVIAAYKVGSRSVIPLGGLRVKVRTVVLVQLIALNLVLHFFLSMSKYFLAIPISLLVATVSGIAYGALIRREKELRQKLESKEEGLELVNHENKLFILQLMREDEIERRILAGDLHDQVLNDLKLVREKTSASVTGTIGQEIDGLLVRSMQQVREVMDSLSPAVLQHLGFADAVEDCIRKGAERAGYKVRFRCSVDQEEFDVFNTTEQAALYRLVQESVTNICKHANASVVKCSLTTDGDKLIITISDNGKGIDQSALSGDSHGMRYMKERAGIINAFVSWGAGDDDKGTTVEIAILKPKVETV